MQATLWALDLETGETLWQTKLGEISTFLDLQSWVRSFFIFLVDLNQAWSPALTLWGLIQALNQITMDTEVFVVFSWTATPSWQLDTQMALRAAASSSTKKALPTFGPSTWREPSKTPRRSTSRGCPREPGWLSLTDLKKLILRQIRADPVHGGYVVASTVWSSNCPDDDQNIRIVKLDSGLNVEWSEEFGECDGSDQLFDFVVDRWETWSCLAGK